MRKKKGKKKQGEREREGGIFCFIATVHAFMLRNSCLSVSSGLNIPLLTPSNEHRGFAGVEEGLWE